MFMFLSSWDCEFYNMWLYLVPVSTGRVVMLKYYITSCQPWFTYPWWIKKCTARIIRVKKAKPNSGLTGHSLGSVNQLILAFWISWSQSQLIWAFERETWSLKCSAFWLYLWNFYLGLIFRITQEKNTNSFVDSSIKALRDSQGISTVVEVWSRTTCFGCLSVSWTSRGCASHIDTVLSTHVKHQILIPYSLKPTAK